jgi:hypothetical protein
MTAVEFFSPEEKFVPLQLENALDPAQVVATSFQVFWFA